MLESTKKDPKMAVWDLREKSGSKGDSCELDDSVLKGRVIRDTDERPSLTLVELPAGCKVLEARRFSSAAWTTAIRIIVELQDGTTKSYFLKVSSR